MNTKTCCSKLLRIAALSTHYKVKSWALQIGNETMHIVDAPLMTILGENIACKYEIIEVGEERFGQHFPNGTWTGLIGMIQKGKADLAFAKLSFNEARASVVDFSYPYQYSPISFITDKPTQVPNSYAMVYPFSLSVWIGLAITIVIMQFLLYFFERKTYSFQSILFKIFGTLLENTVDMRLDKLSTRILMLSWIIGAMFLTQSYKAVLLSFFTFPTLSGIRNIAQLSKATEKNSFKCSAYEGSRIYADMFNKGDEALKKIGRCLDRTNMYSIDILPFLLPATYRKALIGPQSHLRSLQRGFFVSADIFYTDFYYIAVRKSFLCKDALDQVLHKLSAAGILQKFQNEEEFFLEFSRPRIQFDEFKSNRKLGLEDFSRAFFILFFGYVSATALLLLNVLFHRYRLYLRKQRKLRPPV